MAVIPLLMLATNGMTPAEGPFASAWFNTIKGFSVVVGTGLTEGITTLREHFHSNVLVDQWGNRAYGPGIAGDHPARLAQIAGHIREQALVLASADVFRLMAVVAVALIVLIPFVATRIYPPGSVAHGVSR
jgi:DHA2 family multidrug resistance protein